MKIAGFLLLGLAAGVSAGRLNEMKMPEIKADSDLGLKLLSEARQLEEGDYDNTWISGYSIKFQGCHHISQWNDEAEDEDSVRIKTKRLVRFRLCPTDYCSTDSNGGCDSGYGDYVIDLYTYLSYYFQARETYQEFNCGYLQNYVCGCNNNNNNVQYCLYDCYEDHGMADVCMGYNPYEQNNNGDYQNNQIDLQDYMDCTESDVQDANGNGLYIGPYCAAQGGAIYLGVFSDDSCTNFADEDGGASTYKYASGYALPYADANIVDLDCMSCKEPSENNNGGNDRYDADDVAEVCEEIYTMAGKCEQNLPYQTTVNQNNNACNYMEGIKIVRKDGTVITADARANKTAAVFIGVFVVAFILLAAYVYYLKTKLDRASINLAE